MVFSLAQDAANTDGNIRTCDGYTFLSEIQISHGFIRAQAGELIAQV